mgnify:CR=1 FL=1|jgi:hypothetical protein
MTPKDIITDHKRRFNIDFENVFIVPLIFETRNNGYFAKDPFKRSVKVCALGPGQMVALNSL